MSRDIEPAIFSTLPLRRSITLQSNRVCRRLYDNIYTSVRQQQAPFIDQSRKCNGIDVHRYLPFMYKEIQVCCTILSRTVPNSITKSILFVYLPFQAQYCR